MPKPLSRFPALIALFSLIGLAAFGCSQGITNVPEPTLTIEPTATEEFIPIVAKNAEEIVIFSFEEDGYAHLFAYIPDKLPLTRLTSGDWDDITPSAGPDGEKIAFASNRNGFWDLYLLALASNDITPVSYTHLTLPTIYSV